MGSRCRILANHAYPNTVHWLKAKQSPEQRRRAEQVMRATKELTPRQRLLLIGRMLVTMQPLPPQTWDDALESELEEMTQ